MNYLITGVAGFIGMHVASRLLDEGKNVIGIDNINDYYDISLKKNRINFITNKNKNFQFHQIDLTDEYKLKEIFSTNSINYVINLAAQAGVRYSINNPRTYINSNIIGFFNIIDLCRLYKVQHLFYASSSSVYGLNENIPYVESNNTDKPAALYGATKES